MHSVSDGDDYCEKNKAGKENRTIWMEAVQIQIISLRWEGCILISEQRFEKVGRAPEPSQQSKGGTCNSGITAVQHGHDTATCRQSPWLLGRDPSTSEHPFWGHFWRPLQTSRGKCEAWGCPSGSRHLPKEPRSQPITGSRPMLSGISVATRPLPLSRV